MRKILIEVEKCSKSTLFPMEKPILKEYVKSPRESFPEGCPLEEIENDEK